jgi:hypothetical protein
MKVKEDLITHRSKRGKPISALVLADPPWLTSVFKSFQFEMQYTFLNVPVSPGVKENLKITMMDEICPFGIRPSVATILPAAALDVHARTAQARQNHDKAIMLFICSSRANSFVTFHL